MKKRRNIKGHAVRHAIAIGILALLIAGLASIVSQTVVGEITVIAAAFILLIAVILLGIVFDVIGVAVTAALETELHARSVNNVPGAAQAVRLVKNAHRVASFCNDVVGDVCGTLSGAIGVTIVFKILSNPSEQSLIWGTTLMTALVAALAVGGKAFGKSFAINRGTTIILRVGQCLAGLEKFLPFQFFGNAKERKCNRSRSRR